MANKFLLYKYQEGDVITLKKTHPCGSAKWQATRVGAEVKLKCMGCGHEVVMKRPVLEKSTVLVEREEG
ncbi:MAG: DUF951 domain-containing protein [Clostridia bacterium]|nr:DUF951 domain-containing protein [Clostridia bacterium]